MVYVKKQYKNKSAGRKDRRKTLDNAGITKNFLEFLRRVEFVFQVLEENLEDRITGNMAVGHETYLGTVCSCVRYLEYIL